ncbi:cysteine hydrolase family protein [Oceanirhabdus seepicola]|uniref:nicotinamidase n=1 Tax=Oceanirhabdus seepicola TaxID=2828781 RepID=A0A9J6NVS3_9CLOT|nr:isochorismatase family cysteine hydrolase [Oceanirhabdus seepicola]MCM1988355.1 cysteine hydrolase [Oceanirhabdus seepicola]
MSEKKNLLVVVDYQRDFVNGSLGFKGAELLYDKILEKVREYKENIDYIIFTMDTHDKDYLRTLEGKYLPIEHCVKDSEGHKLFGKELKKIAEDKAVYIIQKNKFGTMEFMKLKEELGEIESVELCGIDTNICVLSNAIICQTVFENSEIFIRKNLCGSGNKDLERKTFEIMKNLQMHVIENQK